MFDNNGDLYIENENGEVKVVSVATLQIILKPKHEEASLNVEVVFVNVINGEKIANIFKKLGV